MELQALIYEAKKGSKAAEEGLYNRLSKKYFRLCMRYVQNEHDAEERMSDGFYKFFRCLPRFNYESDEELYSFISRIMMNECITQLRKKRLFNIVAAPLETDAVLDEDMLDRISETEIHAAIRKLPAGARTVFNLNVLEGCRHEEIARLLGITSSASRAQLTRAKHLLQRSLSFLKKNDGNQESR
ncbi:MAG: sigma-70 family RNA polymerase sigma factor [Ferruginibacter sp.]